MIRVPLISGICLDRECLAGLLGEPGRIEEDINELQTVLGGG